MNEVVFNWDVFFRGVVPFGAAHIYAMVFIYFFLVRDKIGRSYPFYCIFILSFIAFLCGPLINLLPFESPKYGYDIFRNVVLFSVGIPSLLLALFIQAEHKLNKKLSLLPFLLGGLWSVFFILSPPIFFKQSQEVVWLAHLFDIQRSHLFFAQLAFISMLLIAPCFYLLLHKPNKNVVIHTWGVLCFSFFMAIGIIFREWEIYYAGSSLSALIWAWAVYRDLHFTNQKIIQHAKHQELLAKAQYSASNNIEFTDYYPETLNDSYPFRERATLLEAVCTASVGLVHACTDELLKALKNFTQEQQEPYRTRAKEVLFMLFDSVIFQCGQAKTLITRLSQKGAELDRAQSIVEIDNIIIEESQFLADTVLSEPEPRSETDHQLIDSVKTYVLAHYHQDISINDLVKALGVSRTHIMKVFKEGCDQTINQYLTEVRINKAKSLLLSQLVTTTAFEVGFNNSAYFATVFKKHTGITPKEYQLQAKQKVIANSM
ncbi:helix-turn-helix domain-containing protein [Thalassotalea agariperforans]